MCVEEEEEEGYRMGVGDKERYPQEKEQARTGKAHIFLPQPGDPASE